MSLSLQGKHLADNMHGPTGGMGGQEMSADINTDLACRRTRAAFQRTLMAWTRTAVSLVGFGFSIPKFFSVLVTSERSRQAVGDAPVRLGLMLIAVGTLSLVAGMVAHVLQMRKLEPDRPFRDWLSLAFGMSVAVAIAGFYAFFDIVLMRLSG
jgi:putative membrane protein